MRTETKTETNRKMWAILIARKALGFLPYIISLLYVLACGALALLGTQMWSEAYTALSPMVESGEIPKAVVELPLGIMLVLMALILILMRRQHK